MALLVIQNKEIGREVVDRTWNIISQNMQDIYVERTLESFKVKPQTVRRSGGLSNKRNTFELIRMRMGVSGAYVCYDGHRRHHWMEDSHRRQEIDEECKRRNIRLVDLSTSESHVSRYNIGVMNQNTRDWNMVMTPEIIEDLDPNRLIHMMVFNYKQKPSNTLSERGNVSVSVGFTGLNVKLTVKSVTSPSVLKNTTKRDVELMVTLTTVFQKMYHQMRYADRCPFPPSN